MPAAHKRTRRTKLRPQSRGFSTKIHLATDALGNALRFILTGGERNDITQAQALVKEFSAEYVIADKGYDSEAFVWHLKERDG